MGNLCSINHLILYLIIIYEFTGHLPVLFLHVSGIMPCRTMSVITCGTIFLEIIRCNHQAYSKYSSAWIIAPLLGTNAVVS